MVIKTLIVTILLAAVVPHAVTISQPTTPVLSPAPPSPECRVVYIDNEPDHCILLPAENEG